MQLKRVIYIQCGEIYFIHFILRRPSADLSKVAENYILLQTNQQSLNGDCGAAEGL